MKTLPAKTAARTVVRRLRKEGMKTLRENALKKFAQGLTSLEEVLRITSEE